MNRKLDRAFWVITITVICLWLVVSICGCEYFTNAKEFERLPGETVEQYEERIENIVPELRFPVIDTSEALAYLVSAGGLTGLAAWIRKVKKNGNVEVTRLTAKLEKLERAFDDYVKSKTDNIVKP